MQITEVLLYYTAHYSIFSIRTYTDNLLQTKAKEPVISGNISLTIITDHMNVAVMIE